MQRSYQKKLKIYSSCTSILDPDIWNHVINLCAVDSDPYSFEPEPGEEYVLVWKNPKTKKTEVQKASEEDILSLKMIVEGITPEEVTGAGNLPVGAVDAVIDRAVRKGLLFAPRSLIRRDPFFPLDVRIQKNVSCRLLLLLCNGI